MAPTECPKGQILRDGYYRKSYTRKDGVHVKGGYVEPTCIKDLGKPGKGEKIIKISPEGIGEFGFSVKDNQAKRRQAIDRAVEAKGYLFVFRRLHSLSVLYKNTHPLYHKRMMSDKDYIRKHYMQKLKNK